MPFAPGVLSMVFTSFFRSKNTSFFASGLFAMEYNMPSCSPTNSRSLPGQRAMSVGWLIFTSGNTRADLKGGGGSGLPVIFDVVHGLCFAGSFAFSFSLSLSSAAREGQPSARMSATTANPATAAQLCVKRREDMGNFRRVIVDQWKRV